MAGLNDAAMNLYNEFNRNDLEPDKLAALHLPLTGEQKIEISFRGNPGVRVDALHILSEGHIRCLGLAILLAKAQSIQSPLIVFDDAINAIDHDHRSGIRETIFESDHFAETQLIVTCHSNEFIKDIQQHLPAQRRGDCQVYLFRNHTGNYQPRVTGNVPSKNYVVKARASKDALDTSRGPRRHAGRALRCCLRRCGAGSPATIWACSTCSSLASARSPACAICARRSANGSKTRRPSTTPTSPCSWPPTAGFLASRPPTLVWTYLNKGTHEEANRDDFDAALVETVVQTLEALDGLDLRVGR